MNCVNKMRQCRFSFIIYMIDMEKEPDDYIAAVKEWVVAKKDTMYKEFLNTETGNPTDLSRCEKEVNNFGNKLLRAINGEKKEDLKKLGWPQELMECIRDPSVNLVIMDFIHLACIMYPNSNSIYILEDLKKKLNSGLE